MYKIHSRRPWEQWFIFCSKIFFEKISSLENCKNQQSEQIQLLGSSEIMTVLRSLVDQGWVTKSNSSITS